MSRSDTLADWLAAVAQGDREAFSALYDACSPHLYALTLRMLKRRDWAEEALCDAFARIWRDADRYTPEHGAPLAWLMSMARYQALGLLRQRRRESAVTEEWQPGLYSMLIDSTAEPDMRAEDIAALASLQACLEGLQDMERESVLLTCYEGYTCSELAARLQAPPATARGWLRRGLFRLRTCLG